MSKEKRADFSYVRRFQFWNRGVQILLSISLMLVVNYLAAYYFVRKDVSHRSLYSLGAETKAYLQQIATPVEIYVTLTPQTNDKSTEKIFADIERLLGLYRDEAATLEGKSLISYEFINLFQERLRAEELRQRFQLDSTSAVIVASGNRYRMLSIPDLYVMENSEPVAFRGEQQITSAILGVTMAESPKVYFTQGHGEMQLSSADPARGLSLLKDFLLQRNISLSDVDLMKSKGVPEDADILCIIGARTAFTDREQSWIQEYVNAGGRLLFFVDVGIDLRLEDLFYEWRILVDDMVVVDLNKDQQTTAGNLLIRHYSQHPITAALLENNFNTQFGFTRPVRLDPGAPTDERLLFKEILATSKDARAIRNYRAKKISFDPRTDLQGQIPVGIAADRTLQSDLGLNIRRGKIVGFGNSDFAANQLFQAYGNQILLAKTFDWLLDRDESLLKIPPKKLATYQATLSQKEFWKLCLYFAVVPFVFMLLGIVTSVLRNR